MDGGFSPCPRLPSHVHVPAPVPQFRQHLFQPFHPRRLQPGSGDPTQVIVLLVRWPRPVCPHEAPRRQRLPHVRGHRVLRPRKPRGFRSRHDPLHSQIRRWEEIDRSVFTAARRPRSRAVARLYNVIRAELQVSPPPKATSRTVSPVLARPPRTASSSAIGTDAAEVLPNRSRLTTTLSAENPVASKAASMIRWFTWWGMSRSIRHPSSAQSAWACSTSSIIR